MILPKGEKMVRTHIQLTEEQAQRLKQLAGPRGRFYGYANSVQRRLLCARKLTQRCKDLTKSPRPLSVIGKYTSQQGDISQEHDRYLATLYAEVGS